MATDSLKHTLYRTVLIQLAVVVATAAVSLTQKDLEFALAVLYGGAVTIAGTLIFAWRLRNATSADDGNKAAVDALELYKGLLQKLVLIIGLLWLGLDYLELNALAVLIGFAIAHAGYLFGRGYAPRSVRRG